MRAAGLQGRVVQVTRRQPGLERFKAKGKKVGLHSGLDYCSPTGYEAMAA